MTVSVLAVLAAVAVLWLLCVWVEDRHVPACNGCRSRRQSRMSWLDDSWLCHECDVMNVYRWTL